MKLFHVSKDGGPDSNVTGYWLIEWKRFFSIVLLRFKKGTREAYHTHAFDAVSWVLKGEMHEQVPYFVVPGLAGNIVTPLKPSWKPIYTSKHRLHRVEGIAPNTWALSFRGPWVDKWVEYFDDSRGFVVLTHGRKVVK